LYHQMRRQKQNQARYQETNSRNFRQQTTAPPTLDLHQQNTKHCRTE
jgi:hypothetical protein